MNWVDLVVLGVIALSALVGIMRGLVREVLGLAAWAAALLIASPYGALPYVQPIARQNINDPAIADGVAFGLVFLAALIVLSIVVSRISGAVRGSALGGLDRTLGLPFGAARGAILLAVAFVVGGYVINPEQWPAPVLQARALPLVQRSAEWLAAQLPPAYRPPMPKLPPGRTTTAADLLRANPAGRALGSRPTRD